MTAPAVRAGTILDVIVVGDGPAGLALGAACSSATLDVLVVGNGRAWTPTYATWIDDVPGHADTLATRTPVDVVAVTRRRLAREYGVFDNDLLRASLDSAPRLEADVVGAEHGDTCSTVVTRAGDRLAARLVVDATGFRPALVTSPSRRRRSTVQSAYGLVIEGRPSAVDGEAAVLMDWRPAGGAQEATFLYAVPLAAGRWLVEETSLAREQAMAPEELRGRLAQRLGHDLTADAERVEHVTIPMPMGVPPRSQRVVGFGAAGGYIHPATGYSVAASLRAAPRVAAGIADALGRTDDPRGLSLAAWNAVWPGEHRRARSLHDYGLAALLRMSPDEVRAFFEAFFALRADQWGQYLRIDTSAADVARVMRAVFSAVPGRLRRKLALGSPSAFAGLLR